MLTPALASGAATEDNTPTSEKASGPRIRRHLQPFSHLTPSGTTPSPHTTDSSSPVRVTETSDPDAAPAGASSPGSSRQTASRPGRTDMASPLRPILEDVPPPTDSRSTTLAHETSGSLQPLPATPNS